MKTTRHVCELCNAAAVAYCPADDALLCWVCDAMVHGANFLVARHIRQLICHRCKGFSSDSISGVGFRAVVRFLCPSCSPPSPAATHDDDDGDLFHSLSSFSSSCVSSTQTESLSSSSSTGKGGSTAAQRTRPAWRRRRRVVDSKAEAIFVSWCTRIGLMTAEDAADVVRTACDAALGFDQCTILPFRVSLAASLWFAIRFCQVRSLSTWRSIKRFDVISGVPPKHISAAESRLQRIFNTAARKQRRHRHHHDLPEESWDES